MKFLDHMLHSLATHSLMDLTVKAKGDLQHHTVEDVGIALGKAIGEALGDRAGIRRFGDAVVPMDDALALAAVDLVKRPFSVLDLKLERVTLEDAPRRTSSTSSAHSRRRSRRPSTSRSSKGATTTTSTRPPSRPSPSPSGRRPRRTRGAPGARAALIQGLDVSGATCA